MKISVGLLALCLALCHAAPAFEEGKKYTYEYEGKFGTGVADTAVTQFSGKGYKGLLHVQYSGDKLTLQFEHLKSGEFNKRLHDVYDTVHIQYEDNDILRKHEYPFYGEYHDGQITASLHPKEAHVLSSNTKRAILSLFQVVFPEEHEHDHYYHVKEHGIGGNCDTTYVIKHEPHDGHPDAEVLNVTKNRHYDRCDHHPHMFFSSMTGYKCTHCKEEEFKPLAHLSRVDYHMKGNKKKHVIEHIYGSGYISFTPFTTNGQTVHSIVNQTLHLVKVGAADLPAPDGSYKKHEGLHFEFLDEKHDYDHEDLKENYHYLSQTTDRAARLALAEKYLPPVEIPFSEYHHLAEYIHKLGYAFLAFDYADFETFFKKHVNFEESASPAEKDRRRFLFKVLPLVGTNSAIKYAIHIIKDYHVPERLAMEDLVVLPHYAKTPSAPLVDYYYDFVKSDLFSKKPTSPFASAAWLSFGTFVYKACVKDVFNPHPHHHETFIGKEKCEKYVEDLIHKFESAPTSEEKSIYIRALKNTQTKKAFDYMVKHVIPHGKYDAFIREVAIWGLEHFIPEYKEEVYQVLFPIISDIHEDYSLRIYAFDILVYGNPSAMFFANLVVCVNKEPNAQVASYIYSSLKTFANSTDPCLEDVAEHARHVLPYIRNTHFDVVRHSTNKIYSFYNEKYGFGRTSQFVWLGSNNTAFPREIYMRQAVNLAGYNFDFLEAGIVQRDSYNFDTFLAMALKQYNLIYRPKMGGDDYGVAKHVDQEHYSKGMYEVYSRLFNQDAVVAHEFSLKDSPYITELSSNKFDIHFTKVVSSAQVVYLIPNEMGLCTSLYLHAPVVAKLQGTVEVKDLKTQGALALEFGFDVKYGFDILMKAGMEVHSSPNVGPHGYALETNFAYKSPFHGYIDYDMESHEVKIKEDVPSEPIDALHYHTYPYTYTNRDQKTPVVYSDKPVTRQYKFGHNYFGYGAKVQLQYDYYWNDYGSYRNFFKTFFHKSSRYEDYFDLADKWYAGSRGFFDYAIFNPTARPFELRVKFEPATSNPATEYEYTFKGMDSHLYNEEKSKPDYPVKHKQFSLEVVAKGQTPRKWVAEFTADYHWPVFDSRKFSFHFKRTALPNYDDKTYEICYDSEAEVHGLKSIHKDFLKKDHDVKIDYHGTFKAGETCSAASSRQVEFKGVARQTEEYESIDKDKLPFYQKCKEDYQKGYEWSYACWKVMLDQGRLGNYVMDIEYSDNISPKVKTAFHRFWLWFRHTFYNNLRVDLEPNPDIPAHHLRVVANVSYFHPVMDVHVYRPHETVHYHNVYIPTIIPRYEPVTIIEPFWARYLRRGLNFHKPLCFLSGDHVSTLDGVVYKYKLGDCYHVAVADCASEDILVMYKHVDNGKYSKAMKVVLYEAKIEIKPEGDHLEVYVDGEKVDHKPAYIKKADDRVAFAVYKKFDTFVVNAKSSGLYIVFDGKNTMIKVSNLFRGRQCGMCGDFNGDKYHEFRSVDGVLHKDGSEFAHSYAVHKDGCHA